MSQPHLPNITPSISLSRDEVINLLISSLAMSELGLSHIINAEGEKIQYALGTLPGLNGPRPTMGDILCREREREWHTRYHRQATNDPPDEAEYGDPSVPKDLKNIEIHLLNTGHFPLEEDLELSISWQNELG